METCKDKYKVIGEFRVAEHSMVIVGIGRNACTLSAKEYENMILEEKGGKNHGEYN